MKVIIYRDKETKKIVRDGGDDYERLKERGKTDEDIAALVEEFNARENCPQTVEIVELDEIAEHYMTRKQNAYREQLNDFAFMEDRLDELSRMIENYIDEAKKAYKEEEQPMDEKRILDATCGARSIWFDRNNPDCVFVDNRVEYNTKIWQSKTTGKERFITVNPDVVVDFTDLPFPDNTFYLVVFDPPHLLKVGENAWLKKKYGKLPEDWPRLIHDGFCECMRVLKPNGTLVFKWNETDIAVKQIITAIGKDPLFGHKSGKQSKTHWLCFMK